MVGHIGRSLVSCRVVDKISGAAAWIVVVLMGHCDHVGVLRENAVTVLRVPIRNCEERGIIDENEVAWALQDLALREGGQVGGKQLVRDGALYCNSFAFGHCKFVEE